jgi:hypothetical protein
MTSTLWRKGIWDNSTIRYDQTDADHNSHSYFEDGKFSDFTILCDGKEYHVHRCFIAPQSKYFERACTGMFKEGAERKIELKEDLTSMVDRMVYYFYNFNYRTSSNSTKPAEMIAWPALSVHIQMYSIADKYDVPGLRTLALEKFKAFLAGPEATCTNLENATYAINKLQLPEADTALRVLLVDAWLLRGFAKEFIVQQPKSFATLMVSAPWLSIGFHSRALLTLQFSHIVKQASCDKCMTPAFFTQGEGFVNCKKCKAALPIKRLHLMKSEVLIPE